MRAGGISGFPRNGGRRRAERTGADSRYPRDESHLTASASRAVGPHHDGFANDSLLVDIFESERKHGVNDDDLLHAVGFALLEAEEDDGKVLYPGPDKAGNLLEVVTVRRDDATEIAIHAMKKRRMYEPLLRETGGTDD